MNDNAGSMLPMLGFFNQKGYGNNELYITTYGPNGTLIGAGNALYCSYIKQVISLNILFLKKLNNLRSDSCW